MLCLSFYHLFWKMKFMLTFEWFTGHTHAHAHTHTHTHSRLTALFPGLLGSASTRKVKPIWIVLKQETVSGSGISWAICKSAPRSRHITMPAPHRSVFYRPDALPATQPAASKHWRQDFQAIRYLKLVWNYWIWWTAFKLLKEWNCFLVWGYI